MALAAAGGGLAPRAGGECVGGRVGGPARVSTARSRSATGVRPTPRARRVVAIIAEADLVALHCTIHGTPLGARRGSTGRHAAWTATVFRRVRDGQLVDGFGTWDWLSLLRQLGVTDTREIASA
jgi:hypothetical protein